MFFKTVPHISIDIETRNLTKEEIEFEGGFVKHHPGTKDPGKQVAQILKKKKDLEEKGALTNTCEIGSIAIHSHGTSPVVLHTFSSFSGKIKGVNVDHMPFETEAEMLGSFSDLMDSACDEETVLVVANRDFDFPKLRYGCVRHRVKMPECIQPKAPNEIYDVTFMGAKYFLVGGKYFISLDELSSRLGVETGGKAISGAEVPGMIDRGEFIIEGI